MSQKKKMKKKKKKYARGYLPEYPKMGFIESIRSTNKQLPMCLLCHQTFHNEAKPIARTPWKNFKYYLNVFKIVLHLKKPSRNKTQKTNMD
jgi:hypothetical protein